MVGGSGVHSFDENHPAEMPTALEAGTLNVPGIAGLGAGVRWILEQGVELLHARETALACLFYEQVRSLPDVTLYGDFAVQERAPIVSLNLAGEDSARVADILWEDYGICVRAGAHCAPLMHKVLGTVEQGVVRFSFSHTNTEQEVLQAAAACKTALYRPFIPCDRGSHGLGKALHGSQYPGPFDSAATGALGRVRPCVADAAGGLAAVAVKA